METALIIAMLASAMFAGYILGVTRKDRDIDREMNTAYLTGHVDGYAKAEHDLIITEWKEGK
jgi:hypothetical protein